VFYIIVILGQSLLYRCLFNGGRLRKKVEEGKEKAKKARKSGARKRLRKEGEKRGTFCRLFGKRWNEAGKARGKKFLMSREKAKKKE